MNDAPQQSSRTSHGDAVRLGRKVWCHSSQLATNTVPASAKPQAGKNRKRGKLHPPGTQPREPQRAISEEVAGLANVMVDLLPASVGDRSEECLKQNAQRMRRPIGAKIFRRFHCDHGDPNRNRPPCTDQEPGSPRTGLRPWGGEPGSPRTGLRPWGGEPEAVPATRHDSWAPRA